MPYAILMEKLAPALTNDALQALKNDRRDLIDRLGTPGTLVDVAREVVGLDENESAYLEKMPPALQEGIRAAISAAIEARKSVHIHYSPGYDFEVRLWDYGQAVSVHVSAPYPPTYPRDEFTQRQSG
jgi:hypothetical protein